MVITRIDITINGNGRSYKGEPGVELVKHGVWEIDKVAGKTLCRVTIKATVEEENQLYLDFIPDESFIYRLVDLFCEAEYCNDVFKFKNPQLSERRPAQFSGKLKFLKSIIEKWDEKIDGLTNPTLF